MEGEGVREGLGNLVGQGGGGGGEEQEEEETGGGGEDHPLSALVSVWLPLVQSTEVGQGCGVQTKIAKRKATEGWKQRGGETVVPVLRGQNNLYF